jgi:outer membrane receptor protein involved in Fe transport
MKSRRFALPLGLSVALACSLNAHAESTSGDSQPGAQPEEKLEEVIVTAERRTSEVQKAATSVAVRSGEDLRTRGRFSLQQILEDVPGVVYSNLNAAISTAGSDTQGTSVIIRGAVPNTAPTGSTLSVVPTTAVYTDDVYEGIGGDYDIDRVEILRGPQGTLYGRSATGGVVATHTRSPELGKWGADFTAEYGTYDLRHGTAVFNLPVADMVAVRLAGNEYERDGYYSKDGGATSTKAGKAKLLFQPNDALSILAGWALQDQVSHSGGAIASLVAPNTFAFHPSSISEGLNIFRQYWANATWNAGPVTLTYIPAYRTWYQNVPGAVLLGPGGMTIVNPIATPKDRFLTHEVRLASNNMRISWQIGALYYDNELTNASSVRTQATGALAFAALTDKETKDVGVFAEAIYPFAATWRLTAGLRYDYTYVNTQESYTSNLNAFRLPENNVTAIIAGSAGISRFYDRTYKLRVEKDLSRSNLLYASISTGFLPGDVGATVGAGNLPLAVPYAEETLTAYEIGSKNRFLDESLQINGDVYYNRYSGYQQIINTNPTDPFNPVFSPATSPARMLGLELEGLYQLTRDDRVSLTYAYINAYFVDRPAFFADSVAKSKIPQVAPNTLTVAYEHLLRLPGGSQLRFHGDTRYLSSFNSSPLSPADLAAGIEPYDRIPSAWIGDLDLTWVSPGGRYSVTGYVRNVGDNRYKYLANVQGAAVANVVATPYDPRTGGVVVHLSF